MRFLQPSALLLATTSSSLLLRRQFVHSSKAHCSFTMPASACIDLLTDSPYSIDRLIPSQYEPIPASKYSLKKLVIIHRHGDRAQIAKSLGDHYQVTPEVTNRWTELLPTEKTMKQLQAVAFTADENDPNQLLPLSPSGQVNLFSGWDVSNMPYGQLTDLGARQLMELGLRLRRNYQEHSAVVPLELSQAAEKLYSRTTNFCRTHQSTRGLLAGLFLPTSTSTLSDIRPTITTRPRKAETLYPQADANCVAMLRRRGEIFSEKVLQSIIPNYGLIKDKMQQIFHFPDGKINWLHIKEVLLCHEVHNIQPSIPLSRRGLDSKIPLSVEEVQRSGDVATMTWSVLYNDDILNRMAIGRFLHELLVDMSLAESNPLCDKTMLVYSGHDSTIVPVLCALKCFDDKWPEYASSIIFEITEDNITKQEMIRVIYNDKVMYPWGNQDQWMPLTDFEHRLGTLRLSPEDYDKCCKGETLPPLSSSPAREKERLQQIQEDIERETKATTSGDSDNKSV